MAIKIAIKKTVQDFEIGNKTYEMDFRDEKIKEYIAHINKVTAAIDETKHLDPMKDSEESFKKLEEELRGFTDIAFGPHAYDEIYETVNRSSAALSDVIAQVMDEAQNQMDIFQEVHRQEKKADYYKKKNKK